MILSTIVAGLILSSQHPSTVNKQYVEEKYVVTSYSTHPSENGGYTVTCTGKPLRKGIIAVDPRFIPLGTKLWVPGYGWGMAADTGGYIRGRHIDLCTGNASRQLASRWGRKLLVIRIYSHKKAHK